jgi:predicted nucleotidyltransferase
MVSQSVSNIIKSTVQSIIPDARVVLFGSMLRGDNVKNSDYDLLIVTKDTIPAKEKISWLGKLHGALVHALDAPVDVLLNSEEEVQEKKQLIGHVVRSAMKEGLEL